MSEQPKKKRKFVVLKRRPQTETPAESAKSASPDVAILDDETDIYDLSAHVKEVPVSVSPVIKADPVVATKAKPEPVTPKRVARNTRSSAKSKVVDLEAESTPNEEELSDSDFGSDLDPDKELQEALARARRMREEKEHAEALLRGEQEDETPEIDPYSILSQETPKVKKPKAYRGEKVCFRLAFPTVEGHSWPSVIFTTRSLVPFHEIQEKLTTILHQRCQEDELYPPGDHLLEEFIFVLRGSRIYRNSTCQTMGISTRDPEACPEVQWLNVEDAEKFRKRSLLDDEDDVVVDRGDYDGEEVEPYVEEEVEEEKEAEEEEIELTMTGKDKKPVTVRVGVSRQFVKLAEHYAKEMGVAPQSVQLFFDGDKIDLDSTVEEADVEDEDMLEVRLV